MSIGTDLAGTDLVFAGYPRAGGRYGVRNHVLVLALNGLVARSAARVAASVAGTVLFASPYGRGQYGADRQAHTVQLAGVAGNPNVAATLVIGADRRTTDAIVDAIARAGKPVEALALDDVGEDALELSARAIRIAARLVHDASRQRRQPAPLSALFLGVECGHSDATSGVVANPLAGRVVDRVVDAGGTAVFGETIEWLGAEHMLAARAVNADVAEAIKSAVLRRERHAVDAGLDLLGNNPGPTNVTAGLSTIEEKSLGAIAKGGQSPIRGVIGIADTIPGPGLYLMDAPAYAPESVGGIVASGAQLMLFTTGVGNSFVSGLAPTIKISGNPVTARRLHEQLDFDASDVFERRASLSDAAARLQTVMLEVASGTLTWGEILDEGDDVISRLGPAL